MDAPGETATASAPGRFQPLFSALVDAVALVRLPERRFLDVNPAFERLFGVSREEALASTAERLHLSPDAADRFERIFRPTLERGEVASLEWELRGAGGETIPCHVTLSRAGHDEDGAPLALGIARDLREQRRREAALATLQRVQQEIARELELERVVQLATDAATSISGAAFGAFFYNVNDRNGERYTLFTLSGAPREAFEGFGLPRNTAVFSPAFHGEGIVRSDDITKDPRYGRSAPHHGLPKGHLPVRSFLAVPVISRSGVVHGGLFFGHPEPGRFSEESERVVGAIAAQTAIALDNAHLYRAAREGEEAVRDRETQLAQAQAIAHLGSWTMDLASGRIEWSDEQYRIHGLAGPPEGGMDYARFLAIVHPEDRAFVEDTMARIVPRGDAGEGEYRIVRPDGEIRYVHARAQVLRDAEGKPARAVGTVLDITERKHAEIALRESEERFRTLVTATTQMVWTTDADGMVVDLPEWRAFTGQTQAEVRGEGWIDAVHPEDRERVAVLWGRAFAARTQYEASYRVRGKDGLYRHFLARAVPRVAPDGRLLEYIGTWTDVTEQKRALQEADVLRAQLVQGEKLSALGSLVSGVAHEIRTPLTYLTNNLQLVESAVRRALSALPPTEAEAALAPLRERLDDAHEAAGRVARIVEDLRRHTRLRPSDQVRAPLDVLVRDAVELYRATHRGEVVVDDDLAPTAIVLADRVQLQQVVLNLMQNAGEARPADGRVHVRTRQTPEGPLIEVEDHGAGIPGEVAARMWDPFYTTKKEGTGLGLSIVKRIVDAHRATIHCESEPGRGTRFRILFPSA